MTILWNGYRNQLDASFAGMVDAALGPLPWTYNITSGYRSAAQQNALFAKGRDNSGKVIAPQDTVTNARAGQSAHNFGCAVDFVPSDDTHYANVHKASWQEAIRAVQANPLLLSGATFTITSGSPDYGHIELRDWRSRRTVSDVTAVATGIPPQPATVPVAATENGGGASSASESVSGGPAATLFYLDVGVGVAVAAVIGLVAVWWWKGRV